MREASSILKYLSNNYSTDDEYSHDFHHNKPVLGSRKKINDLLLSGLTFTNKQSGRYFGNLDIDVKCLVESDSIRSKYIPRNSNKKNSFGLNRVSMTSHQAKRRPKNSRTVLNEYNSKTPYIISGQKPNQSVMLQPVVRNPAFSLNNSYTGTVDNKRNISTSVYSKRSFIRDRPKGGKHTSNPINPRRLYP